MSRVIACDVGNSNIVLGCFEGERLLMTDRLQTHRKWTLQSMEHSIRQAFSANQLADSRFDGSILSSVVPELNLILSEALAKITGKKTMVMNTSLETGISMGRYDTATLGMDRVVDLAAAASYYGTPAAIYDLGTCTTLSVLDRNAVLLGGMISAGIQLSLDVQAERTAQLPQLTAAPTEDLLGNDTVSNMISGAVASCGIMIDEVTDRIAETYGLKDMKVVITGGNGKLVLPWIRKEVFYDPDLLLKGLLAIYRKNAEEDR
ncbi:MAG: type III pantothenate kinase [Eubacterium sp.]|nr:type III pantothenate kinase [Eubacterium sp.]